MNHTITNAAGITILEPLDNNFKTGGGPVSIGGCVVVASKGKPFVPLEIQPESTWSGGKTSLEQILGSPLSKKAYGMEGLRQLSDACKECSWVNAVRVVSTKGYRYPSLAFLMFRDLKTAWATDTSYKPGDLVTDADKQWVCAVAHVASAANKPGTETGEWLPFSGPVETAAHRYNEEVLVGDDGFWMVFYPIDGCDCQKRTVRIEDVDTARQRFTLSIYEKDDAGYESLLEGYEVGIGEDDKDDMGRPAYIETVFETRSSHYDQETRPFPPRRADTGQGGKKDCWRGHGHRRTPCRRIGNWQRRKDCNYGCPPRSGSWWGTFGPCQPRNWKGRVRSYRHCETRHCTGRGNIQTGREGSPRRRQGHPNSWPAIGGRACR